MAARLSFYFILAFFPFLIFVSALIGFVPVDPELLSKILLEMETFLPERTYTRFRDFTIDLVNSQDSGVVSIGILLALWWASTAFRGMTGVLNRALAITETRSFLKVHLLAMGVTILVSLFVITSGVLLFLGDWLIQLLLQQITIDPYASLSGPLANHLLRQSLDLAVFLSQHGNTDRLLLPSSSPSGVDPCLSGECDCQFVLDPGIESLCIFRQPIGGLRNLPTTLWKSGHPDPPDDLAVPLQLFPAAGRGNQFGDFSPAKSRSRLALHHQGTKEEISPQRHGDTEKKILSFVLLLTVGAHRVRPQQGHCSGLPGVWEAPQCADSGEPTSPAPSLTTLSILGLTPQAISHRPFRAHDLASSDRAPGSSPRAAQARLSHTRSSRNGAAFI